MGKVQLQELPAVARSECIFLDAPRSLMVPTSVLRDFVGPSASLTIIDSEYMYTDLDVIPHCCP